MIRRVISGGQIGADIAGLRAARKAGIPTGGYAPKQFKTQRGTNPLLGSVYGLTDTGAGYKQRTEMNVAGSDGTIRFAVNWNSPGERSTLNAIVKHRKPHYDVPIMVSSGGYFFPEGEESSQAFWARLWVAEHSVEVLNVAGNAIVSIEPLVEEFLAQMFPC